ncbi:MAG: transcription antitermination factor NusB [Elusimicrobiaceae bacterium]
MGKRRLAREYCLQALYLADTGKMTKDEALSVLADSFVMDKATEQFAVSLLSGTLDNKDKLDDTIQTYATNWKITRMSAVDRCILRLASFEIIFVTDTPVPAVIDEAIELAKKFSTENSGSFINGLLDRMKTERA